MGGMDAARVLYGNDPQKIERYRAFWDRAPVERPLVGFTRVGWFPLQEFRASAGWEIGSDLTPEMIDPRELVPDHLTMIGEGDFIDDDLIRGIGPMNVAVPFLPAMLGCRLRVLPDNVLGVERNLSWEEALAVRLDPRDAWYRTCMTLVDALVAAADGAFPVSHGAEIGPADVLAVLRGHTQSILDMVEEPRRAGRLLERGGRWLADLTDAVWGRIPRFEGGWFDGQYSLWAPRPILRLQEDASAVFSPGLYRRCVQPVDRMLARRFDCAFMHLHSTSMFLLEEFLDIAELGCFVINHDVGGPPLKEMVGHFRRVQAAGRSLLIRGALTPEDVRLLGDALGARGLFLLVMVRDLGEIEDIKKIVGM